MTSGTSPLLLKLVPVWLHCGVNAMEQNQKMLQEYAPAWGADSCPAQQLKMKPAAKAADVQRCSLA